MEQHRRSWKWNFSAVKISLETWMVLVRWNQAPLEPPLQQDQRPRTSHLYLPLPFVPLQAFVCAEPTLLLGPGLLSSEQPVPGHQGCSAVSLPCQSRVSPAFPVPTDQNHLLCSFPCLAARSAFRDEPTASLQQPVYSVTWEN